MPTHSHIHLHLTILANAFLHKQLTTSGNNQLESISSVIWTGKQKLVALNQEGLNRIYSQWKL